ncbi:hypothetical protein DDZ16_18140 [Marinilabilia rubra]|uniref:Uncharacterized protein n=1 Tax=Marinilabilia rubra TaxID=2162893 RepID=A0A2U2B4K6_9BACT|nr:hypothetical protein DDZ16_18140 [Marinilabilia rubra]
MVVTDDWLTAPRCKQGAGGVGRYLYGGKTMRLSSMLNVILSLSKNLFLDKQMFRLRSTWHSFGVLYF